jgi:hypothetical protein
LDKYRKAFLKKVHTINTKPTKTNARTFPYIRIIWLSIKLKFVIIASVLKVNLTGSLTRSVIPNKICEKGPTRVRLAREKIAESKANRMLKKASPL